MISIKIICVGELKEKYSSQMQAEYLKRLSKYCNIEIVQLRDEKLPSTLNEGNNLVVRQKEAELIISRMSKISNSYVFALDEKGIEYTSLELASKIEKIATNGNSNIVFVIGGSLGLTDKVRSLSNETISFSKLTFPHQLIRIFLLEQIFRVFKINNNETYHH